MTELQERLFAMRDEAYADFQAKLTPGIPRELFIGMRVPVLRTFAKKFIKDPLCTEFIRELPHKYYDENMLHGLLISEMNDYSACISATERFLPFIDNWAVCDIMSPRIFKKHRTELIEKIREWSRSEKVYTCRFGVEMLMSHFLDDDFRMEYLEIPAKIESDEYYVNMMLAWFFATALAKRREETLPYLTEGRLSPWVHNKTIQKACESLRITPEQKDFLRKLRR